MTDAETAYEMDLRLFRVSALDCGHEFTTPKYTYRKNPGKWPEFLCEVCGEWSVGHDIRTLL